MVLPMPREEDDRDVAVLPHPRRIARRAMGCHEKFRLFVFEFERVTQGRPSDDSNDNRRHGSGRKAVPR